MKRDACYQISSFQLALHWYRRAHRHDVSRELLRFGAAGALVVALAIGAYWVAG